MRINDIKKEKEMKRNVDKNSIVFLPTEPNVYLYVFIIQFHSTFAFIHRSNNLSQLRHQNWNLISPLCVTCATIYQSSR